MDLSQIKDIAQLIATSGTVVAIGIDENGKIVPLNNSTVFGNEYQFSQSLTISTTTSTTFQNKITLLTSNLPLGDYKLNVSYGWNHDSVNKDFESRITLNGSQLGEFHKQEPKDAAGNDPTGTNQRQFVSRTQILPSIQGEQTINLEYRSDTAGAESSIWEALIEIYRVR